MSAQARAATERIRVGRPLSILDGVPVAIGDETYQTPNTSKRKYWNASSRT